MSEQEKAPKASVVIIGYNAEKEIPRSIESVVRQTLKEIEIIIVDDGSQDDTLKIAERYAAADNRIKVIHQENAGILWARLKGISKATGQYIFTVDSDDWIKDTLIEELYEQATQMNADVVTSNLMKCDNAENVFEIENTSPRILEEDQYLSEVLVQKINHNICGKLYRREFLNAMEMKFPPVSMGEDLIFNIVVGCYSPKVVVTSICGYYYQWIIGDQEKANSSRLLEIPDTLDIVKETLKKKGIWEQFQEHYEFLYFMNVYYYYVVGSNRTGYSIKKSLYDKWKLQNLAIKENKYYKEFKENGVAIGSIIMLKLYSYNFKLAFRVIQILLKIHDGLKGIINYVNKY